MGIVNQTKNIPYMIIFTDNETAYLSGMHGNIETKDKADKIINSLINFYSRYDNEYIEYLNYKLQKDAEKEYKELLEENKREQIKRAKEQHKGYVYIFSCGDKYKIGFSNNIERRLQQLDTRPFPLKCVYSKYFDNAWYIEQWIHNNTDVANDRVDGEWYKISDEHLQDIIDWLEALTDEQWIREENGEV